MDDFDFSKLKERYKKWTGNSFDDKDFTSFGLVNEQGDLTNAGALFADESPIYCSRLFCTRWNGLNKSGGTVDALDDAEYSGSVISLIENGEAFIKRNCKMKWRKKPSFRSDRYQFTVVMQNLNFDVPQDKLDAQIMDLIRRDSKISTEKIALVLGVSSKTIKRHIKEMDNVNYIGRGFRGHWEITDNK